MKIEFGPWYAPPERPSHYTHEVQASLPSLGPFYGDKRIPALLVTLQYRLDPKTHTLTQDIFLHFQVDGPSNAQLNFPHAMVQADYSRKDECRFRVHMDAAFDQSTTLSRTIKGGGDIKLERGPVSGGLEGSYESGKQYAETQTVIHARIEGLFQAKVQHNRLHLSAYVVGEALNHRSR